jgi:hypothetical protein
MMEMISLGTSIAALLAACGACFWAGRVDARLNNGLSESIKATREDVGKIFARLDSLPCGAHHEQLRSIERSLERLADRE